MKAPGSSCIGDQDYPKSKDWTAFVHNYQYIISKIPDDSTTITVAARKRVRTAMEEIRDIYTMMLGTIQKLRAQLRASTSKNDRQESEQPSQAEKSQSSCSDAVKHTNKQTNGQEREILRLTFKVSVTSKDLSLMSAKVKTALQRGVNPTDAGATVQEIRQTRRGVIIYCDKKEDAERLNEAITYQIEDIFPIPGAKTRTSNRGRKPTRANVITSSPYKNQLTESLRLAETRGQGRRGGRSRGRGRGFGSSQGGVCSSNKANRRQNVDTSSSSSESDAIIETDSEYDDQVNSDTPESLDTSCIFCGMNYSSDTHGEEWIQCLSCSLWLIQPVQALKAKIIFVIFVVKV
ncbi:hypothetical protein FQA39_LY00398 [Lamprigera yunnana]|nr:hypothetical protein FQA39_LY00398 [Lamprigera yunnana]